MKTSALKKIENKIINFKDSDKIWSYSDFEDLSFESASKALSVLCKKNILKRAQKGLYYRPRKTILGEVKPDDLSLLFLKLNKKADFYCVSGLNGYNKIGLTTQVPNTVTIACNKAMRSTDRVKFILRNKPHSGTAIERVVLDALIDIDHIPGTTSKDIITKIKELISLNKVNINDLLISALKEPPRVKALIGAIAQELGINNSSLIDLKNTLNPSTTYSLDIDSVLKYAKEWKIKVK